MLHILPYTPILSFLGEDALQLATTCKAAFNEVHKFINSNILFRYPGENNTFKWYHPQRIRIGGCFGAIPVKDSFLLNDANYMQVKLPPKHYDIHWDLLPSNLTHLTLGPHFNSPIANVLPHSLTHLAFDAHDFSCSRFNYPLDNLPPSLTHLTISDMFNKPVDNLPSTLTHLILVGRAFNQSINNLPPHLLHLEVSDYAHPLESLPASLTFLLIIPGLAVGETSLLDKLPNLTTFKCHSQVPSDLKLPASVENLQLSNTLDTFPPNLKHLEIRFEATEDLSFPSSIISLQLHNNGEPFKLLLPPNLQSLKLGGLITLLLPLPSSLVSLDLTSLDQTPTDLLLHVLTLPNLTSLSLRLSNQIDPVKNTITLPPNLRHFSVRDYLGSDSFFDFINSIDFASASLQDLGLYSDTPRELSSPYPQSLTSLETDNIVFQGELPQTLTKLSFNMKKMKSQFQLPSLPDGLTHLNCAYCLPPTSYPPKLQSLDLSAFMGKIQPLPSSLKRLVLSSHSGNKMPVLPASLRKLVAPDKILSPDAFIPPHLYYLNVQYSKMLPAEFPVTLEDCTFANKPDRYRP